jgi:hypothetical protein
VINAVGGVQTADGETIIIDELVPNATISSLPFSTLTSNFGLGVNTGAGNDRVSVTLGEVQSRLKIGVSVDLGLNEDEFWISSYGAIAAGATVTIKVTGNDGSDALAAGVYNDVIGALNLSVKGGAGNDSLTVDVGGSHNGKTNVDVSGGLGDDLLTLNENVDPYGTGQLSLAASGDGGYDTAYVNGAFLLSGIEEWFDLII